MSIFDLFRKKPAKAGTPAPARKDPPDEDLPFNKDALFQMVFREMAFLSPSSLFVSGLSSISSAKNTSTLRGSSAPEM